MKRIVIFSAILFLLACNNDGNRESGTVNDGIKPIDDNGALKDKPGPLTDSTNNPVENKTRTDIEQRDNLKTPGQ